MVPSPLFLLLFSCRKRFFYFSKSFAAVACNALPKTGRAYTLDMHYTMQKCMCMCAWNSTLLLLYLGSVPTTAVVHPLLLFLSLPFTSFMSLTRSCFYLALFALLTAYAFESNLTCICAISISDSFLNISPPFFCLVAATYLWISQLLWQRSVQPFRIFAFASLANHTFQTHFLLKRFLLSFFWLSCYGLPSSNPHSSFDRSVALDCIGQFIFTTSNITTT